MFIFIEYFRSSVIEGIISLLCTVNPEEIDPFNFLSNYGNMNQSGVIFFGPQALWLYFSSFY